MTPAEQLRTERRARFYGTSSGVGQRERNAAPTPTEAVDMARRATEVDAEIWQHRPELRSAMRTETAALPARHEPRARQAGTPLTERERSRRLLDLRRRELALLAG